MKLQDKSDGKSSERIKHKDICNDTKGRRSTKLIAGQAVEDWFNCGIKVKIYSTMFLHSKKGQFTTAGS